MSNVSWAVPTVALANVPGQTIELNSLANGTSNNGTVIDNETNRATHMDLQLHLASLNLSAQTNPSVTIHLLETADGSTTYDDGDDATANDALQSAKPPAAIFPLREGTAAETKDVTISGIQIPPGRWLIALTNETGVAFAVSGNTLKYRTYKLEIA